MEIAEEIWKDIEGYEGCYQISSVGRVKSLARASINRGIRGVANWKERIIKPQINKRFGYNFSNLSLNGKKSTPKTHRLVAIAFIPNPLNLPEVNHINGIKTDNRVVNLEWCNRSQNMIHAHATGLQSNCGSKNPASKLSEENVLFIRKSSLSCKALSEAYNVSASAIYDIKNQRTWLSI